MPIEILACLLGTLILIPLPLILGLLANTWQWSQHDQMIRDLADQGCSPDEIAEAHNAFLVQVEK